MASRTFTSILALVGNQEQGEVKVSNQLVQKRGSTRNFFEVVFVYPSNEALPRVDDQNLGGELLSKISHGLASFFGYETRVEAASLKKGLQWTRQFLCRTPEAILYLWQREFTMQIQNALRSGHRDLRKHRLASRETE